jgi:hypothetical protein
VEKGLDDKAEKGLDDKAEKGLDDKAEKGLDDKAEKGLDDKAEKGRDVWSRQRWNQLQVFDQTIFFGSRATGDTGGRGQGVVIQRDW